MSFMPTSRPPYTPPCENSVPCPPPAIICSGGALCSTICVDVVLDPDGAFPQWYVDGVVDYNLQTLVLNGTAPIVWAISAGALPAGLSLVDGHITGTVTAGASTGSVTLTATNCEAGTDDVVMTWDVNACTEASNIEPAPEDIPAPIVGVDYEVQFTADGTTPIVWSIDPLPDGATFTEDGLLTIPGELVTDDELVFTVTATGPCGDPVEAEYTIQGAEAITLRYGNLVYDPFPAAGPTFVAGDFTGGGPLFADYTEIDALAAVTREGDYLFPGGTGVRQVMWIADALLTGSPNFEVTGFAWGIDPAANTPYQSLTILGVPGKVYFTADQNNGSYTLSVE